jgi:hypothetical protein
MRPSWEELAQLRRIISLASSRPDNHIKVIYLDAYRGTVMRIYGVRSPDHVYEEAMLPHFIDAVPAGPGYEAERMLVYMGLAKASTRQAEFMDYATLAYEFGKQNHAQALGTLPGDS